MENISAVVRHLRKELERAKTEIERYSAALAALGSSKLGGQRRTLSAAARRKISLAQKARWAKQNGQAAARPKRPVSAAARRKMAAAQAGEVGESEGSEESSVNGGVGNVSFTSDIR
jgi:hypothetical protein